MWFWTMSAEDAGFLVVGAATLETDGLGHGDLDGVDVAAVPDRLEDHVSKAQDEDVLDGLFPEIVVDAVDLGLVKDVVGDGVEGLSGGKVAAEGLLDDDAGSAGGRG